MSELDFQSVVSVTQGWEPNVQMQGSTLSTLQGRYDMGHNRMSTLYGSLLNSPLSRSENIKARDEFFKIINNDVEKIGEIDLSLQANVTAASKVFQSIYANKDLTKDMVWTGKFNKQLARAEAFKNCVDPAKCGGQYWEEGEKYLHYKRQEFMTASREEAMAFQDVSYVPYNNLMEKAIEHADKAGLNITKDVISGGYKVTTKNGEALAAPLTSLFTQLFEQNPEFHEMFKVQSYNTRKDWISQQMASGTYGSEGEAMVGYVQQRADVTNRRISSLITDIDNDASKLAERYDELSAKYNRGEIHEGDPEYLRLQELHNQKAQIAQAVEYSEVLKATQKNMNNTQNIRVIADMLDDQNAALLFNDEITRAAGTLAYKDYEVKLEEDKFALEEQSFRHDVQLEQIKHRNSKDLVSWKAEHGAYSGGSTSANKMLNTLTTFQQAKAGVEKISPKEKLYTLLSQDANFGSIEGLSQAKGHKGVMEWIEGLPNNHPGKAKAMSEYQKYGTEFKAAQIKSNKAAVDAINQGNDLTPEDFYLSALDDDIINAIDASNPELAAQLIEAETLRRSKK